MRPTRTAAPLAIAFALMVSAGCANGKDDNTGAPPEISTTLSPAGAPPVTETTPAAPPPATTAAAPQWPQPEDCVTYDADALVKHYEAGIHVIRAGSQELMRFGGGPGDVVGEQGLALAKRYRMRCYLGRGNGREFPFEYSFDYWRDPSGMHTDIPEENCSDYDRGNLRADDMGGGHGWRVRDHDHVLHVFDNERDAQNGKLVLAKYGVICYIGSGGEDFEEDVVTYSK